MKIDSLIVEKEKLIADLESYKKSLIYEYVTGKGSLTEYLRDIFMDKNFNCNENFDAFLKMINEL